MKHSNFIITSIASSLIILLSGTLMAQEKVIEAKKAPDLVFSCKKLSDGSFELKARLSLFENRKDIAIPNELINFQVGTDSAITISNNKTDKNGNAIAVIKAGTKIVRDKEGKILAKADYAGSAKYESASNEVSFIETDITVNCEMVDSIKTVKVSAWKINGDGSKVPLTGENITVSIQRMFSRLPVGDISLGEEGNGSVEFPTGIPGDSTGNLQVVAFMSDNEVYGNIEKSVLVKWGIPKHQVLLTHRALWTQIAPLWMIVSLTILLVGVWAHYLYVIIQLVIIKIKGKLV